MGDIHKWLVTLKRRNTIEDLNNGVKGIFTVKTVIVECSQEGIERQISYDDFEIDNIQDWDLLQKVQQMESIRWIFNNA